MSGRSASRKPEGTLATTYRIDITRLTVRCLEVGAGAFSLLAAVIPGSFIRSSAVSSPAGALAAGGTEFIERQLAMTDRGGGGQ